MARLICRITDAPLDGAELLRDLPAPADGAVLLFWGIVRDHNQGRPVDHLEYHAYAAMAEAEMRRIAEEAAARWDMGNVAVIHRVGRLDIGEASVAIAVSSPHRAAAYDASRYIIEELKRRVPIWKREGYADGAEADPGEWLGGQLPALDSAAPVQATER